MPSKLPILATLAKSLSLLAIVCALIGMNRFVDSKLPWLATPAPLTPQDLGATFVPEIGEWVVYEDQIKALNDEATISEEELREYARTHALYGDMFLLACLAAMSAAAVIVMKHPCELTPLLVLWAALSLTLVFDQLPALATAALALSSGFAYVVKRNDAASRKQSAHER